MADTAMVRLRAISPDAGKRVDDRMVAIGTFLSVGATRARLPGPERSCPDRTFLPHLRSIVVKAYGAHNAVPAVAAMAINFAATTARRTRVPARSSAHHYGPTRKVETEVRAALGAPANTNLSIATILQSIRRLASGSIAMSCVSRPGSLASIACRLSAGCEPPDFSRRKISW